MKLSDLGMIAVTESVTAVRRSMVVGNKKDIRVQVTYKSVNFSMITVGRLPRNDRSCFACNDAASLLSFESLESGISIIRNSIIILNAKRREAIRRIT